MSISTALPRVMIASENAFELTMLSASLKLHGINVVAEVKNQILAENSFRSLQPEVLIIDLMFSHIHFIQIANSFRKTNPNLGIVLLTASPDLRLLGIKENEIPHGVQIVLKGCVGDLSIIGFAIDRSIDSLEILRDAEWVNGNDTVQEGAPAALLKEFTDIQVATLRLLAQGLSNSEIAKVRFVSEKSVEQIVARIAHHLQIAPERSRNLRVAITGEYFNWIGASKEH